jgi:hypothetical protein
VTLTPRSDVRAALGDPSDWYIMSIDNRDDATAATSAIWKYGDAELYFNDLDRVWMIHFDCFDVPKCGTSLILDPWIIRSELPLEALQAGLTNAGITFRSVAHFDPAYTAVDTEGAVQFVVRTTQDAFEKLGLSVFGRSNLTLI